MADTVKQSVLKLKPAPPKLASVLSILVALCWGLLAGLLVCVPAGYYYRFWRDSTAHPRQLGLHAAQRCGHQRGLESVPAAQPAECIFGRVFAGQRLSPPMRTSLLAAADDVIERYRNNSDPAIQDFDWPKASNVLAPRAGNGSRRPRSPRQARALQRVFESGPRTRISRILGGAAEFRGSCFADPALARSASRLGAHLCLFAEERRQSHR